MSKTFDREVYVVKKEEYFNQGAFFMCINFQNHIHIISTFYRFVVTIVPIHSINVE